MNLVRTARPALAPALAPAAVLVPPACPHTRSRSRFRPSARTLAVAYGTAAVLDAASTVYALTYVPDTHEANAVMRFVMDHGGLGTFALVRISLGLLLAFALYRLSQSKETPRWFRASMRLQGWLLPLPAVRRYFQRCAERPAATAYRMLGFAVFVTGAVVVSNVVKIVTEKFGAPLFYFADRYAADGPAGEFARMLGLPGLVTFVVGGMLLVSVVSLLLARYGKVVFVQAAFLFVGLGFGASFVIVAPQVPTIQAEFEKVQQIQDEAIAEGVDLGITCRDDSGRSWNVTGPGASCD